MLYRKADDTPIAFAYIMEEDDKGKIVSYHGGGWGKSVANTLLFYRGMICLVEQWFKSANSLLERQYGCLPIYQKCRFCQPSQLRHLSLLLD